MFLLIDYGMGNLRSVEKALQRVGAPVRVSSDPSEIPGAQALVVPGVGAFDHAVDELRRRKLFDPIVEAVRNGKPYLGLCLGLQLLFPRSDEGRCEGFGLVPGKVIAFRGALKIPHMGWNQVTWSKPGWMQGHDRRPVSNFYFVHSYYVVPHAPEIIAGRTTHGVEFASVIQHKNILATQFHPEKSQKSGLLFVKNYVESLRQA